MRQRTAQGSTAADIPLLGREQELRVVQELLDSVAVGRGAVLLLEGEAGMGKTRLVAEALGRAAASGFHVVRAASEELERSRPFGVLADALALGPDSPDPECAEIGRLLTGDVDAAQASGPFADPGFQIIESIGALLERLAAERPLAVALEDLHWADPSTLRALLSLARRTATVSVLIAFTIRPSPRARELDRVIERLLADGARHMTLKPLDSEAAAALAAEIAAAAPGPRLLAQVSGAAGNPLFVIELVRALRDEGLIRITGGVAEIEETSLPATLRETILRRLSFLPAEALDLLRLASMLGSSFAVGDLSVAAAKPARELLSSMREAIRAGLVGERGGAFAFRHDLIRDAIYDDVPAPLRTDLHREIGGALAAAGASPARVAEQFALAGDPEAVEWLQRAARAVAPRSPLVAADLLRRALELAPPNDPKRDAMTSELLTSLVIVGRMDEVEPLARRVLDHHPPPIVEAAIRGGLGIALWLREARLDAACEQFALAAALADIPDWLGSWTAAVGSMPQVIMADIDGARRTAEEALEAGERTGFTHTICCALQTLSWCALARGDLDPAIELGRRALDVEERSGDTPWRGYLFSNFWLSVVLAEADRPEDVERAIAAGRRRAEALQASLLLGWYSATLGLSKLYGGALHEASVETEAALAIGEEAERRFDVLVSLSVLAWIAVQLGDLDEADAMCARAEPLLETSSTVFAADLIACVRGLVLEGRGQTAEALAVIADAWDRAVGRSVFSLYRLAAPHLVRLALTHGRPDRARSVTEDLEEIARRAGTASAEGMALRCRGILEGDSGVLMSAVEAYRRSPRPLERAAACEDAAAALAGGGRTAEARGLFDEALDVYEMAGAPLRTARAVARMRSVGIRRGARRPRGRPTTGWEALTESERGIVALVAEGLTNAQVAQRLFLSRYTVETHLKHVFAKLGVASRTELAAEAVRRGR